MHVSSIPPRWPIHLLGSRDFLFLLRLISILLNGFSNVRECSGNKKPPQALHATKVLCNTPINHNSHRIFKNNSQNSNLICCQILPASNLNRFLLISSKMSWSKSRFICKLRRQKIDAGHRPRSAALLTYEMAIFDRGTFRADKSIRWRYVSPFRVGRLPQPAWERQQQPKRERERERMKAPPIWPFRSFSAESRSACTRYISTPVAPVTEFSPAPVFVCVRAKTPAFNLLLPPPPSSTPSVSVVLLPSCCSNWQLATVFDCSAVNKSCRNDWTAAPLWPARSLVDVR